MAVVPPAAHSAAPAGSPKRQSRGLVIGVNGVVSAVIVILVMAVALVFNPPAPPSIAEFAPQAQKPITKAPPNLNSSVGNSGACAPGTTSCAHKPPPKKKSHALLPTPTPKPIGVPSALQCYKWPDGSVTQDFDPQSPPCVATWPGQKQGNGGATANGVTATEVRIGVPKDGSIYSTLTTLQPMVDFINSHFELYGRQITIVPFKSQQATDAVPCNQCTQPTAQAADARSAGSYHLFASMDYVDTTGDVRTLPEYIDGLTRQKIISISGGNSSDDVDANVITSEPDYAFTYLPPISDVWTSMGSLVCRQLAGHNAVHSPQFANKPRKFAVMIPVPTQFGGPTYGMSGLFQQLSACGVPKPRVVEYNGAPLKDAPQFVQLRNEGVTSIIFYSTWGGASSTSSPPNVASHVGYRPEWLNVGWKAYNSVGLSATEEAKEVFGVAPFNRQLPYQQEFWAQTAAQGGTPAANLGAMSNGDDFYHELLLIASGVQMAGPHLTPQTFAAALHKTRFPNPGAGASPYWQATVGFPGTEQSMVRDLTGFWFDPAHSSTAEVEETGDASDDWQGFCYVNRGARYGITAWPRTDSFYKGCR
ncbi:MAG TPA: hypothetical protein VHC43_06215 [Mycobacteriales bacterium]|nr:hypothetical protein [Mycobacteriales bacterium]